MFLATVVVTLKPMVNDPQGDTIGNSLRDLGFDTLGSVRAGKYFELRVTETDERLAKARVAEMCDQLLANPIIEDFSFQLEPA